MAEVLIICGGTGGHLTPGVAIAERLLERGHSPRLVISRKPIDTYFQRRYKQFEFVSVPGAAFGLKPTALAKFIFQLFQSFGSSFRLLRQRPDAVVAFGGFLCVPFLILGRLLRIPIYLHEANRIPGRTVRYFARLADHVYLPDGVRLLGLRPGAIRHLGMPLRNEIQHVPKDEIRRRYNIPRHDKVLILVGGSQGALALNQWVERYVKMLAADGIHTFCIAGPGKGKERVEHLKSDSDTPVQVHWIPFADNMADLYSLADLVVCRSGAGTIAELITCLCPSIQVPYPFAADEHQEANAQDLERRGGCVRVPQERMKTLYREVMDLLFNDWLLTRMRENLRALGRSNAAKQLVRELESDWEERVRLTEKKEASVR